MLFTSPRHKCIHFSFRFKRGRNPPALSRHIGGYHAPPEVYREKKKNGKLDLFPNIKMMS